MLEIKFFSAGRCVLILIIIKFLTGTFNISRADGIETLIVSNFFFLYSIVKILSILNRFHELLVISTNLMIFLQVSTKQTTAKKITIKFCSLMPTTANKLRLVEMTKKFLFKKAETISGTNKIF